LRFFFADFATWRELALLGKEISRKGAKTQRIAKTNQDPPLSLLLRSLVAGQYY
jgi:hypothetical protein